MTDLHVPTHPVRFVTAASLFDGHDAAINVMRRLLQSQGAEVVHLGHDRSVATVVRAAMEEDAQGIALSSYQGGHVEYFSYLVEELERHGAGHVQVFGGGGGVIVPEEIALLRSRGVRIFAPEDGQKLGLPGMINDPDRRPATSTWPPRAPTSRRCSPATRPRWPGRSPCWRPAAPPSSRSGWPPRPPSGTCRSWASPAPAGRASPR